MSRLEIKMPAAEGIAAGQTATVKLPIGRRYHEIQVIYAGTTFDISEFSEIRVLANQKVIQRFTGAERDLLNQFDGRQAAQEAATGGTLILPFDRYFLNTLAADEDTAINTGSANKDTGEVINSLNVEFDLASSITGTPALTIYATVSEALPGGPGNVPWILRTQRQCSGLGEFDFADFPRGGVSSLALNRIVFNPSANNITNVRVEADQRVIWERTAALNRKLQREGIRVPQSDWFVLDKTERGYGGDPIDLRNLTDYRYKVTVDGAAVVTVLSEYFGGLGV